MTERQFEIIVSRSTETLFGSGWKVAAQQLNLPTGRLDIMLSDNRDMRHILELKKGKANNSAIVQVLGYANDLTLINRVKYIPWVVAHEIPIKIQKLCETQDVKYLAVSEDKCYELMKQNDLVEKDLLGARKVDGVIYGGGGGKKKGLRTTVPNAIAFKRLPGMVRDIIEDLEKKDGIEIFSGDLQIVVFYAGVKLLGVNRKHRGGSVYVSTGLVLSKEDEELLKKLGFIRMSMVIANKHEHVWWELPFAGKIENFTKAIKFAINKVDVAIGVKTS